jgi:hypothetical protein
MTTPIEALRLLNGPNSILTRSDKQIRQRLGWFTVFLVRPPRRLEERGSPHGTGVLFQVGGRFFVLTAGHCIEEGLAIGLTDARHQPWVPQPQRLAIATDVDAGFIELSHIDARQLQAHTHIFLGPDRLHVASPLSLYTDEDRYLLFGYPATLASQDVSPPTDWLRPLLVDTVVSGRQGTAPYTVGDDQGIDLAIDPARALGKVPDMAGASGAGCWKSGAVENYDGWQPESIRLAGIYVGRPRGEVHRWARFIPISTFLLFISREVPSVASEIASRWPSLVT